MMLLLLILSPVPKNFVCMYVCMCVACTFLFVCLCTCEYVCVGVWAIVYAHVCGDLDAYYF